MSKSEKAPSAVTITKYEDGQPVSTQTLNLKESKMSTKTEATSNAAETKTPAKVAEPKVPADGKLVRDATYTRTDKPIDDTVKHHQQKVLLEVIASGKTALKEIVDTISSDQALVTRMNTRQPIERCVRYHAKILGENGFISVLKAEKPKKEPVAKAEKPTAPAKKLEAPSKLEKAA